MRFTGGPRSCIRHGITGRRPEGVGRGGGLAPHAVRVRGRLPAAVLLLGLVVAPRLLPPVLALLCVVRQGRWGRCPWPGRLAAARGAAPLVEPAILVSPLEHCRWQLQRPIRPKVLQDVQQFCRRWSVIRVSGQQPMNQVLHLLRIRRRAGQVVPCIGDGQSGLILEWVPVEHQGENNATQHPDVYLFSYSELLVEVDHLWWPVHHRGVAVDRLLEVADLLPIHRAHVAFLVAPRAEVAQLELSVGTQQHVLNLQVSMSNRRVLRMQKHNRGDDFQEDG
mmetsp:Transcript_119179/g.379911  ORF Transcript_119179/g.379911 Transcript_119179/m.379911 type:complete len:279 (+) Transcript_119179:1129-1965(+)